MRRLKKLWTERVRPAIVKSKGFLTKKGSLVNYEEVHSLGLGVIDGVQNPRSDYITRLDAVRDVHDDVDAQPHYFMKGFPIGEKLFWVSATVYLALLALFIFWLFKSI